MGGKEGNGGWWVYRGGVKECAQECIYVYYGKCMYTFVECMRIIGVNGRKRKGWRVYKVHGSERVY